jgi:ribosomal protein S18 acetylase RimI-like enzyme
MGSRADPGKLVCTHTTHPMSVRRAVPSDARRIAEIHVLSWQAGYSGIVPGPYLAGLSISDREVTWRQRLSEDSNVLVVAENREVTGWVSGGRARDSDADPATAEIYAIGVDPLHWRAGGGRRLWTALQESVRKAGYEAVTLWVLEENAGARRFYEALGFQLDANARQVIDLGGRTLNEVRYRRGAGVEPAGALPERRNR